MGFWIVLGKGVSPLRALSFLLLVTTVIANRLVVGEHTALDVAGGFIIALLSITIGRVIGLIGIRELVSSKELTPSWPDRIYIPQAASYTWTRSEVAERYPEAVTPLFADLFLPTVGRAVQKMARSYRIKKKSIIIGYCTQKAYIFSNMGPAVLHIPGVLRRFMRIRKDFLHYALIEYPSAKDSFLKHHEILKSRLQDDLQDLKQQYVLLLECMSSFEKWMLQQSISLFYLNFGLIYLRLMVKLHFPIKGNEILRCLPLGLPTISSKESELLYRLGRVLGNRETAWEDLSGEAKTLSEQLLLSLGSQSSSYDFTEKPWEQTPEIILEMARSIAKSGEAPEKQMKRLSQERLKAEDRLAKRLRLLHPFSGKRLSRELIDLTHLLYALKEERQKQMAAAWALVKMVVLRLGNSFKDANMLRHPEDVHFLTANELSGLVHRLTGSRDFLPSLSDSEDVEAIARVRQNQLKVFRGIDIPEHERDEVLELPWKKAQSTTKGLSGKHTLPGQVTAPAVVIKGQQDFHKMYDGAILVAPATNPHWDVLFGMARGIIIERGGPQSHAMLKASEYGIPAIIGLPNATKRIKDGDVLLLDGYRNKLTREGLDV
jgi:phosphohistidine swiveling domain-containing protein